MQSSSFLAEMMRPSYLKQSTNSRKTYYISKLRLHNTVPFLSAKHLYPLLEAPCTHKKEVSRMTEST